MTARRSKTTLVTLAGAGMLVAVGCGAPRPNAALDEARAAYRDANQDPRITKNAPVALHDADVALQRAEREWSRKKDDDEVTHLSYLAKNRVDLAKAVADEKTADSDSEHLANQREDVLVGARTGEANRARQDASRLAEELAALHARETERGLEVTLSDVNFDFNRAELHPVATRELQRLVDYIKTNPTRQILIEGHTDAVGTSTYNMDLSRARADAVRTYLVRQGVDPARITTVGYGETYPVASNDSENGRDQNRRAEITILRPGEVASSHFRSSSAVSGVPAR